MRDTRDNRIIFGNQTPIDAQRPPVPTLRHVIYPARQFRFSSGFAKAFDAFRSPLRAWLD